jgi:hypothetical protein
VPLPRAKERKRKNKESKWDFRRKFRHEGARVGCLEFDKFVEFLNLSGPQREFEKFVEFLNSSNFLRKLRHVSVSKSRIRKSVLYFLK